MENTINASRSDADNFTGQQIKDLQLAGSSRANRQESKFTSTGRPCALVIADSEEGLCSIGSMLSTTGVEIAGARTRDELNRVCREPHDIVIVDLSPAQLGEALRTIRASAHHAEVPLLVALDRIISEKSLAGVLPKYRAMPCSPAEMAVLVNSHTRSKPEVRAASLIL